MSTHAPGQAVGRLLTRVGKAKRVKATRRARRPPQRRRAPARRRIARRGTLRRSRPSDPQARPIAKYQNSLADPFNVIPPYIEAGCFAPRSKLRAWLSNSGVIAATDLFYMVAFWPGSTVVSIAFSGNSIATPISGQTVVPYISSGSASMNAQAQSARPISGGVQCTVSSAATGLMPKCHAGYAEDSWVNFTNRSVNTLTALSTARQIDLTPDMNGAYTTWRPTDFNDFEFSGNFAAASSVILADGLASFIPFIIFQFPAGSQNTLRIDNSIVSHFEAMNGTDFGSALEADPMDILAATVDDLGRAAATDTRPIFGITDGVTSAINLGLSNAARRSAGGAADNGEGSWSSLANRYPGSSAGGRMMRAMPPVPRPTFKTSSSSQLQGRTRTPAASAATSVATSSSSSPSPSYSPHISSPAFPVAPTCLGDPALEPCVACYSLYSPADVSRLIKATKSRHERALQFAEFQRLHPVIETEEPDSPASVRSEPAHPPASSSKKGFFG